MQDPANVEGPAMWWMDVECDVGEGFREGKRIEGAVEVASYVDDHFFEGREVMNGRFEFACCDLLISFDIPPDCRPKWVPDVYKQKKKRGQLKSRPYIFS